MSPGAKVSYGNDLGLRRQRMVESFHEPADRSNGAEIEAGMYALHVIRRPVIVGVNWDCVAYKTEIVLESPVLQVMP